MRLLTKITHTTIATGIGVLGGFIRNKILATLLSVGLFGIVSTGQQSAILMMTVWAVGLQLGITTYSARLVGQAREERRLNTTRLVLLSCVQAAALLAALLAIALGDAVGLSTLVVGRAEYRAEVVILLAMAPLMLVETSLFAVLEGSGHLPGVVMFRVVPAVVTPPFLWFLARAYGLAGAATGLLLNEIFLLLAGLWMLKQHLLWSAQVLHLRPLLKPVYSVGLLSVVVGTGWLAADVLSKRYVLHLFGEEANGIVQSVSKITDMYPTLVLSWLTMHLFPFVARTRDDRTALAAGIERVVLAAMSVIIPVILLLFMFREPVLRILYKGEFVVAGPFLAATLATGIPRVFAWALGTALLPLDMRREWLYASGIVIVVYALIVGTGLTSPLGIYAIPAALGLGFLFQASYTLHVLARARVRFSSTFVRRMGVYALIAGLIAGALVEPWLIGGAVITFLAFVERTGLVRELAERIRKRDVATPS